jgi:hypothetical protein
LPLARWIDEDMSLFRRRLLGLWSVFAETTKGFHYVAWVPALLGLWWSRRQLLPRPAAWLVLVLCLVHVLILWRLTVVATYVSERHVLLLVLCGLFPAAAGFRTLAAFPAAWWRRTPAGWAGRLRLFGSAPAWAVVLLVGTAASGLPKILQPLHANRAGHRAAGLWLARHARPTDLVCDGHFGWAYFYAGRVFTDRGREPLLPRAARTCYIVKGTSREHENPYGPTNARADYTVAEIRAVGGRVVYRWPEKATVAGASVVVWRIELPPGWPGK